MLMPEVLSQSIQDYARPITHPKWRQGGSFNSELFKDGLYLKYRKSFNSLWYDDVILGVLYYNAYSSSYYNI